MKWFRHHIQRRIVARKQNTLHPLSVSEGSIESNQDHDDMPTDRKY